MNKIPHYKKLNEDNDPDRMYKPLLRTNTHTDYDNNKINADWMD